MAITPDKLHGKSFEDYMLFVDNVVSLQNDVFYSKLSAGVECSGIETAKLNIIHYLLKKYQDNVISTEALDCIYNLRPFTGLISEDYTTNAALNTYTYLQTFTNYLQKNYKQCGTTKIIVRTMPTGTSPFTLSPSGGIEVSTDGTTFSTDSLLVQGGDTIYIRATANCTECGKSAYQIWLDLGNTGTEQDFIDSLTGPKGDQGDPANIEGITWKGTWSATPPTAYVVNDAVQYSGTSYVKIGTGGNASLPPNNVANLNISWEVLALAGMTGPAGSNGANGASGVAGFRTLGSSVTAWTLLATDPIGTPGLASDGTTEANTTLTTDAGVFITTSANAAVTLTAPANLTNFPVGYQVSIMQLGTGQVHIVPGSGATIVSANSMSYLRTQNSAATLIKKNATTWYLFGDITNIV